MSEQALAGLFSDIDAFLYRARRVQQARFADDPRTFSVWGSETTVTRCEISLLAKLTEGPLCLAAIAEYLGREYPAAQAFVTKMMAEGLLMRNGNLYGNTRSAYLFLQGLQDGWLD